MRPSIWVISAMWTALVAVLYVVSGGLFVSLLAALFIPSKTKLARSIKERRLRFVLPVLGLVLALILSALLIEHYERASGRDILRESVISAIETAIPRSPTDSGANGQPSIGSTPAQSGATEEPSPSTPLPYSGLQPRLSLGEQYLVSLNRTRTTNGVEPLPMDPDLCAAALRVASGMARRQSLDWDSPDGGSVLDEPMASTGLSWRSAVALAARNNYPEDETLTVMHESFLASPDHRKTMLYPDARRVGIGVVEDESGVFYLTAILADVDEGATPSGGASQ